MKCGTFIRPRKSVGGRKRQRMSLSDGTSQEPGSPRGRGTLSLGLSVLAVGASHGVSRLAVAVYWRQLWILDGAIPQVSHGRPIQLDCLHVLREIRIYRPESRTDCINGC